MEEQGTMAGDPRLCTNCGHMGAMHDYLEAEERHTCDAREDGEYCECTEFRTEA